MENVAHVSLWEWIAGLFRLMLCFVFMHFMLKNFPCVNLTPVACLQREVFWRGDRIQNLPRIGRESGLPWKVWHILYLTGALQQNPVLLLSDILSCCTFDWCLLVLNHQSALPEPSHGLLRFTDISVHSHLGFVTSERRKLSDRSTSYRSFQTDSHHNSYLTVGEDMPMR